MLKILSNSSSPAGSSPKQIADSSPVWEKDIKTFSPWHKDKQGKYFVSESLKSTTSVTVVENCCSVLDLATEIKLKKWDSLLAVSQKRGRGRRSSYWHSPPGNIYAALRLPALAGGWENIVSLFCGYCLNFSLKKKGWSTTIKWPNDILLANQKIAGILVEKKKNRLTAGIGINIINSPSPQELSGSNFFPPGQLSQEKFEAPGPLTVWYYLVKNFEKLYHELVENGTVRGFLSLLQPQLAFYNQPVRIIRKESGNPETAVFTGITREGFARFIINGSEVTLREAKILPA
ncbi:MAG: biotin--[acetyl-CoA-carboxylase] ligase [bacterium]